MSSTTKKVSTPKTNVFADYIKKKTPQKVAAEIGSTVNPVYEWMNKVRQPSFVFACELVRTSKGKLNFEDIYRPFYTPKKK